MRQTTLAFLTRGDGDKREILLALKKRKFGMGKWNGVGGKFDKEKDKTILDTAIREAKEEVGIEAKEISEEGVIRFRFKNKPEWDQDVHIFLIKDWSGEPTESDEMAPKWFDANNLPYNKMWDDDKYWMPNVLAGEKINADCFFKEDGGTVDSFSFREI